jgi:hypothetical protein
VVSTDHVSFDNVSVPRSSSWSIGSARARTHHSNMDTSTACSATTWCSGRRDAVFAYNAAMRDGSPRKALGAAEGPRRGRAVAVAILFATETQNTENARGLRC